MFFFFTSFIENMILLWYVDIVEIVIGFGTIVLVDFWFHF